MSKYTLDDVRNFTLARLEEQAQNFLDNQAKQRKRAATMYHLWQKLDDLGIEKSPNDLWYTECYSSEDISPEDYPKLRRALGKRTVHQKDPVEITKVDDDGQPVEATLRVIYSFDAYPGFRFATITKFKNTFKCRLAVHKRQREPREELSIQCQVA